MSLRTVKVNSYIYYFNKNKTSIIKRKVKDITPSLVITENKQHFNKLDGKLIDNTGLLTIYAHPWDTKAEKIYRNQEKKNESAKLLSSISLIDPNKITPEISHHLKQALEAYNSVKSFIN